MPGGQVVETDAEKSHLAHDGNGIGKSGDGHKQCDSAEHAIAIDGEPGEDGKSPKDSSGEGELDQQRAPMSTAGDGTELIDVAPPMQHCGDGECGTQCEEEDVTEWEADCLAPGPALVPAKETVEKGDRDGKQGQRDG